MRVVISSPLMLPAINGTTIFAKQLSDYFNARVIASNATDWVALHSPRGKTHSNGYGIKLLASLINSADLSLLKRMSEGLLNAYINGPVSDGLFRELLISEADIIHSLTLPFLNNYYSYWASRLSGKKFVITPFFIKGFVKNSHKRLLSKADLVLACTNHEREVIGLPNVRVLPMSVNPLLFSKARGERFRKKYGITGRMVLFVGHANMMKGAYDLVKAARLLPGINFVFLGPHTAGFKSLAKGLSNVRLVNPQLTNKFDAFAACDVYAMPSRVEAFGITYLEAWACRKPVIAFDTPVSNEVIGDAGFLVSGVDELVSSITESFNRSDLGVKGYYRLINDFTESRVLAKLSDYYSVI